MFTQYNPHFGFDLVGLGEIGLTNQFSGLGLAGLGFNNFGLSEFGAFNTFW